MSGPGDVEGTWDIPRAALTVTYVIAVDGDQLRGSGVVSDLAGVDGTYHPILMTGTRLAVDLPALGQLGPSGLPS